MVSNDVFEETTEKLYGMSEFKLKMFLAYFLADISISLSDELWKEAFYNGEKAVD